MRRSWLVFGALIPAVGCVQQQDVGVFVEEAPDAGAASEDIGEPAWSHTFGGGGNDRALSVAVADDGGVVMAGHFGGSVDFGGGAISGSTTASGVLVRFDAAGEHVWSRSISGPGHTEIFGIALGDDGAVYASGTLSGAADFGDGVVVDHYAGFVAKYDRDGNHVWSITLGDDAGDGRDIAIAPNGDVVVTGFYYGTWSAGEIEWSAEGSASDMYLARFTADGELVWATHSSGLGHATGLGVAANEDAVYVTGQLGGSDFPADEMFGTTAFRSVPGNSEAYVARYTSAGDLDWVTLFTGDHNDIGNDLDLMSDGTVVITGNFQEDLTIGDSLYDFGSTGDYVAALDPLGNVLWSRAFDTNGVPFSVDVGPADEIAISGWYNDGANFGGGELHSSEGLFVAEYSSSGEYLKSAGLGANGPYTDIAFDVALTSDALVVVGKLSNDGADVGGGPVDVQGEADMFVAKFAAPRVPRQ